MHTAGPRAAPAPAPFPAPAELPVELTRFVGRRREVAEVCALLGQGRLLTLTGAGGSGKTRLAREAAASSAGCTEAAVGWVDLTPLSDPDLLPGHVAALLGLREEAGRTPVQALVAALSEGPFLLVLDNCEHVVDACAALVDTLLRSCPLLSVLTTSREALGIAGERAWLVPPLSLPPSPEGADLAATADSEAVQLFVERAQESQPAFRLDESNAAAVARICHRLDGIPLAIELAAARVRVLAPEQIASRLDDAFRLLVASGRTVLPRHRTLRETIEWSHRLLDPAETVLFRGLSVFAGSFSLEAAEAICARGPAVDADSVLDLLASLVDKSLVGMEVRVGEARYRLLDTVRQYGHRRLVEAGELEALQAAHAEWYTALAEEAEPRIFGGSSDPAWLARLREEEGNLRAALDWSEADPSRAEIGLRICAAIHWAWFAWGRFARGRQRLSRALARGVGVAPRVRARASTALGTAAIWQGDLAAAQAPMEEAVALLRTEGPPRTAAEVVDLAYALSGLGAALSLAGKPGPAAELLQESCEIARDLEPCAFTSFLFYWRGVAALARQDRELGRSSLLSALAVGRRLGGGPAVAHPLTVLGRLELLEGRGGEARDHLAEALALHLEASDFWGAVQVIEGLAGLALESGRIEQGARLMGAVDTLRQGIGTPLPSPSEAAIAARVAIARSAFGEAAFDGARAAGRALSRPEAMALARQESEDDGAAPLAAPLVFPARATGSGAPVAEPACGCLPAPGEGDATCEVAPELPATGSGAPALEIDALGSFRLAVAGEPAAGRCTGRARELLVFLACHAEGCTKEQVGLALWPDASPSQVRNLFHVTLHRLRKALGRPEWIVSEGDRYRLDPGTRFVLDATRFEAETTTVLRELRGGGAGDHAATPVDRLAAAVELYRGDLLEGEVAGEWVLEPRGRLEELYLEGLRALGDALATAGRHAEAAEAFRRRLARDELDEATHRRLLAALGEAGDRAGARRSYRRLVDLLQRELDVEPEPETTALYERILRAR